MSKHKTSLQRLNSYIDFYVPESSTGFYLWWFSSLTIWNIHSNSSRSSGSGNNNNLYYNLFKHFVNFDQVCVTFTALYI